MWKRAVFELYNIASTPDFQRLNREAAAGQLTKETFVVKIIECESRAAEKTRRFLYSRVPALGQRSIPADRPEQMADCRTGGFPAKPTSAAYRKAGALLEAL